MITVTITCLNDSENSCLIEVGVIDLHMITSGDITIYLIYFEVSEEILVSHSNIQPCSYNCSEAKMPVIFCLHDLRDLQAESKL